MEDFKFIGKDKVPVIAEINTLDEFKRFVFSYSYSYSYKFDEETPDEFKQIPLASDSSTNYARFYRGNSHVDYCLQSTLERYLEKFGNQIDIRKDYEKLQEKYFEHCKRILINQSIDGYILLPSNLKDDNIWAFAQHYQLKTPLLDWTKSFFVALYFAFESQEENQYRVIYELNEFFNFGEKLIIEPEIKIGNRINAQKGVFTKLSSIEFEDIAKLNTNFGNGHVFHRLSKMLISSKLRKDVLAYLASINIDASTIYPDLLGKIKLCEIGIDNAIAEINLEYQD